MKGLGQETDADKEAATVVVSDWEDRPWIAILSQDGGRVITTYPTDQRTVTNRLGAGRWIKPNT